MKGQGPYNESGYLQFLHELTTRLEVGQLAYWTPDWHDPQHDRVQLRKAAKRVRNNLGSMLRQNRTNMEFRVYVGLDNVVGKRVL